MLKSSVGIDYEDCSSLPGMTISFLMNFFKNSKLVDKTWIQLWVLGKHDYNYFLALERVRI